MVPYPAIASSSLSDAKLYLIYKAIFKYYSLFWARDVDPCNKIAQVIAVTLRLRFAARINYSLVQLLRGSYCSGAML